jgi:hypothetical protein
MPWPTEVATQEIHGDTDRNKIPKKLFEKPPAPKDNDRVSSDSAATITALPLLRDPRLEGHKRLRNWIG